MIETWFISDHHFGHAKILEYEKEARPFSSLEAMHEFMITQWNMCVSKQDIVYHLGDFCFGKRWLPIADRLNGKKRLVLGNHDTYSIAEYAKYFEKVYGMFHWRQCVLSHIPVHPDNLASRWLLNIHGHLHSKRVKKMVNETFQLKTSIDLLPLTFLKPGWEEEDRNYFNVSCEQNHLTPIHSSIIMDRLKELNQ